MKKVVSKGYTITVTSWENDGDNYNTLSLVEENKDKAKAIVEMCKTIFRSCNNGDGGIGNMSEDDESSAAEVIIPFMKRHPILYDNKELTDKELVNLCMKYNRELMGYSEWYYSRVFESCVVTYSDSDILTEEVEL